MSFWSVWYILWSVAQQKTFPIVFLPKIRRIVSDHLIRILLLFHFLKIYARFRFKHNPTAHLDFWIGSLFVNIVHLSRGLLFFSVFYSFAFQSARRFVIRFRIFIFNSGFRLLFRIQNHISQSILTASEYFVGISWKDNLLGSVFCRDKLIVNQMPFKSRQ